MKKILVLMLGVVLCLGVAACSKDEADKGAAVEKVGKEANPLLGKWQSGDGDDVWMFRSDGVLQCAYQGKVMMEYVYTYDTGTKKLNMGGRILQLYWDSSTQFYYNSGSKYVFNKIGS